MASAEDSQRASGSSAGRSSGSSRRQNVGTPQRGGGPIEQARGITNAPQPQQQLSTIEKSVTHLLVATKQLLETLTLWSRGSAAESEVSDVYVRLGYEFNIACRAFNAIGVDTTDLGPVPDLLRAILEDTLSQEANQASLDKYLPRIRDIIINLLHGLKKKQQRLRQRNGKDGAEARPPRQSSTASNASLESNLTQQLEDVPSRASSHRSFAQRQGSNEFGGPDLPPRTTSTQGRTSPRRQNLSPPTSMHQQQLSSRDTSDSTLSSNTMQNIPVIAPYPENDTMPTNQGFDQREQNSPEPPPPPPKQNDALQALQRGGELERRASRRFSAYQIQKHLGTSVNGIGTIPPAQNSPIPNRGRDARESMNAVRSRRSVLQHNRTKSRNDREGYEPSPSRLQHEVRRISETSESDPPQPPFAGKGEPDSPVVKTPEDKLGTAYPFPDLTKDQREGLGATVNGPVEDHFGPPGEMTPQELSTQPATPIAERKSIVRRTSSRLSHPPQRTPPQSQFIGESSPQPGKELTLFLQYKSKIKKFVLSDGADLTVPRLQLAFIEKFAWNTHNNGVDLPEIYIQDPVSGVRHEVEDLSDIKERSVLVLNVEQLDEVKRHIDDGIGGLRRMIEGVKTSVEDQQAAIQRVWERQQESAKEIANIAAAPPAAVVSQTPSTTSSTTSSTTLSRTVSIKDKTGQLDEVQSLRRDLAVVRQTYTTFVDDIKANMATIRTKAASIGPAAAKAAVPELDPNSGRAYVNGGKKTLSDDSEKIVNRVDDLQDTVEDLRKDVVTRGVRPIPRQLEDVSKDISTATADLRKLKEFLKREKPVWTKIWEKELQVVCDDRDLLTMQEELAADLEDDLEKAAATFALVEEATKQQNLANPRATDDPHGPTKTVRSSSRTLRPFAEAQDADPQKAKDGVLGEVRALQPNHESRLEAIERAERARQRELESRRGGEFQKELGNFVEEGKLKKSGGVEEVERLRLVKEERARKENYERVAQRERDRAEREAAAAAAALAPPAEAETQAEGEADAAGADAAPEEASGDGTEVPAEDPAPVADGNADPTPVDANAESGTDGAPSGESVPPAAA
jgi:archaellum component FlaC